MITLLIVDDSQGCREGLAQLVNATMLGVETEIFFASTLEQAKEMTIKHDPHLTFLDLSLPDATVAAVVNAIPHFTPPVIIVSGHHGDEILPGFSRNILLECMEAGAEAYLEKGSPQFFEAQQEWMKVVMRNQHHATTD